MFRASRACRSLLARRRSDQLIETAVRQRPDLAAQVATLDARRADVDRAKARIFPVVGVSAAYGEQAWGYRFDGTPSVRTAQPQYAGLLTFKWDIFTASNASTMSASPSWSRRGGRATKVAGGRCDKRGVARVL